MLRAVVTELVERLREKDGGSARFFGGPSVEGMESQLDIWVVATETIAHMGADTERCRVALYADLPRLRKQAFTLPAEGLQAIAQFVSCPTPWRMGDDAHGPEPRHSCPSALTHPNLVFVFSFFHLSNIL